jgi:tetratricopeptide (TPR) repeat protein
MDWQTGDGEQLISTSAEDEQVALPVSEEQAKQSDQFIEMQDEVTGEAVDEALPAADSERVSEVVSRVDVLTAAIEKRPDAPVNYVLRGEALLDGGDYELAAKDFRKALELAEPQAESANWGYINRALADRAREGLRYCTRATGI